MQSLQQQLIIKLWVIPEMAEKVLTDYNNAILRAMI